MRTFSTLTLALPLLLMASRADATTYPDLCGSVPSACEYSGPNAPVLAAAVCWSRLTKITTLMVGGACPTGSWPYFVKYGVVDPLNLHVSAFVPLEDACSRPGVCLPGSFAPENTTSAPMCCVGDQCWTIEEGLGPVNCEGEVLYCSEGVTNDDGTSTCFDEELA